MSHPGIPHILADEDLVGARPIGIDLVRHGGDKNLVHHCIGLEGLDSLSKVPQSIFHLIVDALCLIDGVAGPLGCRINALHKAEDSFWVQHGKSEVERDRRPKRLLFL